MKKKLTEKQKQTLEKKDKIYKVAIKLFQEYGYDNTSIRDICREANVTTGSLYNLYENKMAILYRFKDNLTKESSEPLEYNNVNLDNPYETLAKYVCSVSKMFNELGVDITLKLHTQYSLIWSQKSEETELLENFIERCQNHHTISDQLSVEDTVDAINIIIYGLVYQWCNQGGDYNLIEKSNLLLPVLLKPFIVTTT